jgi:hypothetical protein
MVHKIPLDFGFRQTISNLEYDFAEQRRELIEKCHPNLVAETPFLFMDRRILQSALSKIKLFEMISDVPGVIIECGVHRGNSLLLWYHLSSILEPYAFTREIIGFDTFSGFPNTSNNDPEDVKVGQLRDTSLQLIKDMIEISDLNRPIQHIQKIELVEGDATLTIPEFVAKNQHIVCSLLYLDFDLYEPTKIALKVLFPLVPIGGIIAFDELAQKKWLGETTAFKEVIGVENVKLRKFANDPHLIYFIKE